jgi:hypothetical protein
MRLSPVYVVGARSRAGAVPLGYLNESGNRLTKHACSAVFEGLKWLFDRSAVLAALA